MELFDVWFKELRWVQDILHVRVVHARAR